MKVNIWKIEGYCGWSDWDTSADNNIHKNLALDAFFSREAVKEIFFNLNTDKYRVVVLDTCEIVKTIEI